MINILFDQYQRYKKTEEIINQLRSNEQKFNILEVGANEHRNLEKFLQNDSITYLDIQLDEALKGDPQFILGDATEMTFEDNSYDLIVALDVFEHIPVERRKKFINELTRVSKIGFILMGPFNTDGVEEAEKNVNEFFKGLMGYDHPWLKEHIENGLPNWDEILEYLTDQGIQYTTLKQGKLSLWENLMRYHFLTVYNGKLLNEIDTINSYYNEYVYPIDVSEQAYRRIIIGSKKSINGLDKINKDVNVGCNELMKLNEVEARFYKKLSNAYANIELVKLKDNHINNIENMLSMKDEHISNIEDMLVAKDNEVNDLKEGIREKEVYIDQQLQLKENHIRNIEEQVDLLRVDVENLRRENTKYMDELEYIYNTLIGRFLRKRANKNR